MVLTCQMDASGRCSLQFYRLVTEIVMSERSLSTPPPTKGHDVTERVMLLLRSARKPCGTVCVVFAANPKQHQGFFTCVGKGASRHERRKAWDETAPFTVHDRCRSTFQKNVKN
jgi:hypothetical protein